MNLVDKLLTSSEKIWLEAIWHKQKNGQEVNERALKVELHSELPKDFQISEINSLLLRGKTNITLLGIGLIDSENTIIKTTDIVMKGIKEILKQSPNIQKINAIQLSDLISLSVKDVEDIFERLSYIGLFHNSGINGKYGWSAISIDENAFDNYLKYESIAQILEDKASIIYHSRGLEVFSFKETQTSNHKKNIDMEIKTDSKIVFVVHGRNSKARKAIFQFLRSIGLQPLEWSQAVERTGKASPYVGEILETAFSIAQAALILFTPDDEALLREEYRGEREPDYEIQLTGQARPNVIFEAGMAMGLYPDRTVLVELGDLRPISDVTGRHIIRLNNSVSRRQELAQRLKVTGCNVNLSGTDWHEDGDFESAINLKKKI